jgi:hypothetical protein
MERTHRAASCGTIGYSGIGGLILRLLTILAVIALPLGAQAQQAWGDDGGCARVAGKQAISDSVFILWPTWIERFESSCNIVGFDGDLNGKSIIQTECTGEGENWTQSYEMTPAGGERYTIWPSDSPHFTTELRPC